MAHPSIKRRLLWWLLVPLLTLLVVGAVTSYYRGLAIANAVHDRALYDSVLSLSVLVSAQEGIVRVDLPSAAQRMIEADLTDKVYFTIRTLKGETLAGDSTLPVFGNAATLTETPRYFDGMHEGERVRVAVARITARGANAQPVIISIAETVNKREEMIDKILSETFGPQLIFLLITVLVVWIAVSRALRPLERISVAIDRRSGSDLQPLATGEIPLEVRPVITALNNLMGRVGESVALQRRFISNAAHQLRTPVAGMRALIEAEMIGLPPDKVSPAMHRMYHSALRMSRMVKQLLALSRAEPGSNVERMDVDLGAIVNRVLFDTESLAQEKGCRIASAIEPGLVIKGDPVLLGEMVSNLIDNAIRYSPAGACVTIRLAQAGGCAELTITDEGAGMGAEERERVFERFYRSGHSRQEGNGLGLSIVREIAEAHGALVCLQSREDRSGTIALASFPLAGAGEDLSQK